MTRDEVKEKEPARSAQSGEWVTVPRPLTRQQIDAVQKKIFLDSNGVETVWNAAIAAAPPAPAAEPFGWVMTEGPIQLFSRTKPDSLVNRWVPVWDAPTPPEASQQQCPCGDREASKCPGEWEPGCDLGANEQHARPASMCGLVGEQASQQQASVFDFLAHLTRQRDWSAKTFGPGPRTAGIIDHIRKELREIEADPADLAEWIDVAILALDGAWRAGHEPNDIIAALQAKQAKNEARTWPDWRTMPAEKAIEHDRSGEASQQQASEGYSTALSYRIRFTRAAPPWVSREVAAIEAELSRLTAELAAAKAEAEALRELIEEISTFAMPHELHKRIDAAIAAQQGQQGGAK